MSNLYQLTKHADFVCLNIVDRRLVADVLSMAIVKDRWVNIKFERVDGKPSHVIREIDSVSDDEYAALLRKGIQETYQNAAELHDKLILKNFDYFSGNIMLNGNDRVHNLAFKGKEQFKLLSPEDQSAVRQAIKVMSDTDLYLGISLKVDPKKQSLNLNQIVALHNVDPENNDSLFLQAKAMQPYIS